MNAYYPDAWCFADEYYDHDDYGDVGYHEHRTIDEVNAELTELAADRDRDYLLIPTLNEVNAELQLLAPERYL